MIQINNVTKIFDEYKAVDNLSTVIKEGEVFGLVGTNGAGKSTLLRMISGIYKPESGNVTIDDEEVWDNAAAKSNIFYLSDDHFFFQGETPVEMLSFYKRFYPSFDEERFYKFLESFNLDKSRKISTFSKGMKKQLSIFYGICSNTKYLLCDETFDGLDPVVRQTVKSLFVKEMENRNFTPIIASHNLRELEDICDHIGLLHKGGILLSKDIEDMKLEIFKVQCVFKDAMDISRLENKFDIMKKEIRGSLFTLIIKGKSSDIHQTMTELETVFYELLPLTLEEIFISETEVVGYDFKNLFQ